MRQGLDAGPGFGCAGAFGAQAELTRNAAGSSRRLEKLLCVQDKALECRGLPARQRAQHE